MCIAMSGLNQNGAARFFGLGECTSRRCTNNTDIGINASVTPAATTCHSIRSADLVIITRRSLAMPVRLAVGFDPVRNGFVHRVPKPAQTRGLSRVECEKAAPDEPHDLCSVRLDHFTWLCRMRLRDGHILMNRQAVAGLHRH